MDSKETEGFYFMRLVETCAGVGGVGMVAGALVIETSCVGVVASLRDRIR